MSNKQKGFTLIELVVVIVILGILAATAMPKFIDLRSDAQEAAFQGVRGAAASAMSINYAGCAAVNNDSAGQPTKCVKVNNCDDTTSVMQGGLPSGYSVAALGAAVGNSVEMTCTLVAAGYTPTGPATFTGIGAGN